MLYFNNKDGMRKKNHKLVSLMNTDTNPPTQNFSKLNPVRCKLSS